jgi:hypothetical protein
MVGRHTGWGIVFNMSDGGLQLATTEEYEPTSLLWLDFQDGDFDSGYLKVRVDRSDYRPGVGWVLDCSFGKHAS